MSTRIQEAQSYLAYELELFSRTVHQYRDEYFHPCNRDLWVARFCEWLAAKQRKAAQAGASND
jgi:hypothetical protein